MIPPQEYETSLVLTGAGSYAAYEVGVMTALFAGHSSATRYTPLNPDLTVGTAAGALNALVLAAQEVRTGSLTAAIAQLRRVWLEQLADGPHRCGNGVFRIRGLPATLLDQSCRGRGLSPFVAEAAEDAGVFLRGSLKTLAALLRFDAPPLRTLAGDLDFAALLSFAPLKETLADVLSLADLNRSTRELRIVATDLNTGTMKLFNNDDVHRLGYQPLLASLALPIFAAPAQIDGDYYINGTILSNTPLLPVILVSSTMHLIYMDPKLSAISPERLESIIDVVDRIMVVNFAAMLNRDLVQAKDVNSTIEMLEDGVTVESLSEQQVHTLLRCLARFRNRSGTSRGYRPLSIHRYHPREDLGSNLGLMNLDVQRINKIIELGYQDAVEHDCVASGCVIPRQRSRTHSRDAPAPRAPAPSVALVETPVYRDDGE
jgi:predicted acylesterase/phospholipase RssA